MLTAIQKQAIHYVFSDYSLLDLMKFTPLLMKDGLTTSDQKEQREAIERFYMEVVLHEHAFLNEVKKSEKHYAILFETYDFSYRFYSNALARTKKIFIDHNYFRSLYENKNKQLPFNPLKENLLFILSTKHEQAKIILS